VKPDFSNMPPLPKLSKPDRRTECGACGINIKGDRKARASGICYTCRNSIEDRGRPLVPFDECNCKCSKHHKFRTVDDGQCGSPVGQGMGRRHTDCCFKPDESYRPGGDPEFRKLFVPYEQEFHKRHQAVRDFYRKQREDRWARGERFPGEVVAEPRSMKTNWTPEAAADLKKMHDNWGKPLDEWAD
jgi:hypothetical protein